MKSTPLPLKAMNNKIHGPYHNMVVSCCFLLPIIDSPMKPLACELQLWLIVVSRLIEAECFPAPVSRCEANSPGDTRGAKRSSRFSRNPSVASAVRTWKLSLHLRGQGQHFSALNTNTNTGFNGSVSPRRKYQAVEPKLGWSHFPGGRLCVGLLGETVTKRLIHWSSWENVKVTPERDSSPPPAAPCVLHSQV